MKNIRAFIKKYLLREILAILFVFVFLAAHFGSFLYVAPAQKAKSKLVYINPKTKFRKIAKLLEDEGIISSNLWFILLAEIKGSVNKIKAGEYELSPSMLPGEVLEKLASGKPSQHMITIPEGFNIYQIADLLDKQGLVKKEEFLARAFDQKLMTLYGFQGPSFEGYLFPDTYAFWRDMRAEDIIQIMAARFKKIYSQRYEKQAIEQGLSMREVITLASVVEKETGQPGERPLIAAVFRNRLRRGIPLQADPTVIYGIKDFNGNLTRKDLETPTPYNTYLLGGLPQGPIACPGEASIKAALNPKGKYLYFVSKNDGSHYFSRTLDEHNLAVGHYQKAENPPTP